MSELSVATGSHRSIATDSSIVQVHRAVAPDATERLIDLQPGVVGMASRFLPRETRLADEKTLLIKTTAPLRKYELVLGEGAELRLLDLDGHSDGALVIPAEALLGSSPGVSSRDPRQPTLSRPGG